MLCSLKSLPVYPAAISNSILGQDKIDLNCPFAYNSWIYIFTCRVCQMSTCHMSAIFNQLLQFTNRWHMLVAFYTSLFFLKTIKLCIHDVCWSQFTWFIPKIGAISFVHSKDIIDSLWNFQSKHEWMQDQQVFCFNWHNFLKL